MTLAEKEELLASELLVIPDRQERLAVLVERARRAAKLQLFERSPAHRVEGCSSAVWLVIQLEEGLVRIRGDAEAPVVRGFVHLLCRLYDGVPAEEAVRADTTLFERIELLRDLSPTRRNGLSAMRAHVRRCAAKLLAAS